MGWTELIILASGLSADACAVSVTNGLCAKKITVWLTLVTAFFFGFFQCTMTILGYILGSTFTSYISKYDHIVVLILLGFIGVKTIIDSIKDQDSKIVCVRISFTTLLVQAVATSIDALAAGVSISAVSGNILTYSAVIGITTFFLCILSVLFGKKFAFVFKKRAQIAGGIILVLIGLKIFIDQQFLQ
ncbi:MAG: manganese efflux pump MntP family protein [Oscillospiraceae bacterium]|nr:manganese efflux pump MntP family protein [Oscillospiraceae bacterium]